jgi:hypothetical protein
MLKKGKQLACDFKQMRWQIRNDGSFLKVLATLFE